MTTKTRDTVGGEHQHDGFGLPDPFRKFPPSVTAANVGFNDELLIAALMGGAGD